MIKVPKFKYQSENKDVVVAIVTLGSFKSEANDLTYCCFWQFTRYTYDAIKSKHEWPTNKYDVLMDMKGNVYNLNTQWLPLKWVPKVIVDSFIRFFGKPKEIGFDLKDEL